jgi:hypothetical protein
MQEVEIGWMEVPTSSGKKVCETSSRWKKIAGHGGAQLSSQQWRGTKIDESHADLPGQKNKTLSPK